MKRFRKYFVFNVLLLAMLSFTFSTCENEDPVDDLITFVWTYSASHPNGFTLDLTSKCPVNYGIVVAYEETQNSFGKESLRKVIEHALVHDNRVGGWLNTDDSNYYYDSDRLFEDGQMTEAIAFAKTNHQLAIYDITNDSVIWIEYPKSVESIKNSQSISYARSQFKFFNAFEQHSTRNAQ